MSAQWVVGDHPLAPMPTGFVVAVDEVIERAAQVDALEASLVLARRRLGETRERMHQRMPAEIDNAKVGFRLPDVFSWRRGESGRDVER